MIIRKPYAFLIKNFKKIHIFLLLLSCFVAFKLFNVSGFVSDFMRFGIYDVYGNPVTDYITFWTLVSVVLLVIGSSALLLLLRHKKKPWKIYLVPIIEYLALFFVLGMIKGFFNGYSSDIETTDLRMSRDLLMMFLVAQLPAIGIFAMRVFGLDIQKFNFNSDQEFLELSEEDREEIEISIDVDKNTFIRFFKRVRRNLGYFYTEHKGICRTIILIFVAIIGFNIYKYFFVTLKSYNEGELYSANGYTITINNSYYTNKSYNGTLISKKSNFVIVDLTLKNNAAPRKVKMDNFHIKNGDKDFTTTQKVYAEEFQDLGTTYDSIKELKRDEEVNLIVVYKVNKNLKKNRFVLFYQEEGGILRKIKLNLKDISNIEDKDVLNMGDEITFNIKNKKQVISLDNYEIANNITFTARTCNTTRCSVDRQNFSAKAGYKVLKIEFASNGYEGKDMIDFSSDYGKIVYIDSKNKETSLDFKYPFSKKATGKYIYALIPDEVEKSEKLEIVFTIRNEKYTYKLK